jgi:hypothetical protein
MQKQRRTFGTCEYLKYPKNTAAELSGQNAYTTGNLLRPANTADTA